ncbi:MAG: peptide deformylase [Candidatus Paceibacterota bacterium]|jgi:peptide deformylase
MVKTAKKNTKIIQHGEKILREKAKEVPVHEITGKEIQKIIADMKNALSKEQDGVAIAAPQIGISLRLFVVSGKAFALDKNPEVTEKEANDKSKYRDMAFVNPKLTKLSRKQPWEVEGCLSVRWLYGKVRRAEKATVTAYDENGKKFTRGASGLLAQIFQHETDHLDGILFIDKAKDVEDLPPESINNK